MKALHATADSDSIRAPGGQGPSLNTPHARDAVPKVWTLRLRSEMGRHRLLTASGDIPAHWLSRDPQALSLVQKLVGKAFPSAQRTSIPMSLPSASRSRTI